MKTVPMLVVLAGTALAGCSSPHGPTPGATPATTSPARAPATVSIHGAATYVERVKMPPGASLRIEVIDAGSQRVVAGTEMHDVAGPPIPFDVRAPATSASATYALRATLSGPDGARWFETPAPVAVSPGDAAIEVRMRRVASTPTAPADASRSTAHWECGDLGVMSRFGGDALNVRLDYNGHRLDLPVARSASGARYADARGNEFWTKGATGTLTLAAEAPRDCVQAAQASPWNQAVLRGVVFRAVGSEPGWSIDVTATPARMAGVLDYGDRRVDTPARTTADGWTATDPTAPLHLRAQRIQCRDGMSGQAFEATVTLDAGGTTYTGCGAWLQD